MTYSRAWVSAYFDEYGEREWVRLSRSPVDRVSFFVHAYYVRQFVRPGARVLEVGAGPGRFTQLLADLGCRVFVSDISEVQLELHRRYARELGFDAAVEDRQILDICDLGALDTESFDAVLCYGGPLSYVFEQAGPALCECVRVCRTGGHVLASVMSLWGSFHRLLQAVLQVPADANRRITDSGDLSPESWDGVRHRSHMFRSGELRDLATEAGLRVVALSASNCLSVNWDEYLSGIDEVSEQWQELLQMELEACREPGCLDAGTHIILVGEKR
jgi:SAM-dependent methyltransferase